MSRSVGMRRLTGALALVATLPTVAAGQSTQDTLHLQRATSAKCHRCMPMKSGPSRKTAPPDFPRSPYVARHRFRAGCRECRVRDTAGLDTPRRGRRSGPGSERRPGLALGHRGAIEHVGELPRGEAGPARRGGAPAVRIPQRGQRVGGGSTHQPRRVDHRAAGGGADRLAHPVGFGAGAAQGRLPSQAVTGSTVDPWRLDGSRRRADRPARIALCRLPPER
jgi:hypothetical protein